MDISVGENNELRLKNVFNSVIFETDEGEELIVCMRDGAFEIAVIDDSIRNIIDGKQVDCYKWYYASKKGIEMKYNVAIDNSNTCKGDSDE